MISHETVLRVADRLTTEGVDEAVIADLRKDFTELHFTYCSDDDIPNHNPVFGQDLFNLYLVDGREHCMCLTEDLNAATGIVVAEIYQD